MKKIYVLFLAFLTVNLSNAQSVSIETRGFLAPRMTDTHRIAISSPTTGLLVYQTNSPSGFYFFKEGAWSRLSETTTYSNGTATPVVTICCQSWMTKNLDVDKYRNGDRIPKVTDPTAWGLLTTGAYCYYNNDSTTYAATYGKLYNWYAINDPRGLAPKGWHVPTEFEWSTLSSCLGGDVVAGSKMKGYPAENFVGFAGLMGGQRMVYNDNVYVFDSFNFAGLFWSSTENGTQAIVHYLFYNNNNLNKANGLKTRGCSVRCLKD